MGRLVSTLSPIVLLPLLSKTFHHKCITLVTSNKQLTKWRGEEWRRLLSGGTLPVQVSRLYRPDQTSSTSMTIMNSKCRCSFLAISIWSKAWLTQVSVRSLFGWKRKMRATFSSGNLTGWEVTKLCVLNTERWWKQEDLYFFFIRRLFSQGSWYWVGGGTTAEQKVVR